MWFPYAAGVLTIFITAILYIRWDFQQLGLGIVPRRVRLPVSLKLKAVAPFFTALLVFWLAHLTLAHLLPRLSPVFITPVYDDRPSRIFGGCFLNFFAGLILYVGSDTLCQRILRTPFLRPGEQAGRSGAELNPYVSLSQCLPPDQHVGG